MAINSERYFSSFLRKRKKYFILHSAKSFFLSLPSYNTKYKTHSSYQKVIYMDISDARRHCMRKILQFPLTTYYKVVHSFKIYLLKIKQNNYENLYIFAFIYSKIVYNSFWYCIFTSLTYMNFQQEYSIHIFYRMYCKALSYFC